MFLRNVVQGFSPASETKFDVNFIIKYVDVLKGGLGTWERPVPEQISD